jgi:diadenosine tetraphosphate (Ap4A) HIT family hydrolase
MRIVRLKSVPRNTSCELCRPQRVVIENDQAYARFDSHPLCDGHVIIVPRRHLADFFEMTVMEHTAVNRLLRAAQAHLSKQLSPDGFNVGVNVGEAAGQNRMHVHVHLIPRYIGDVEEPRGGVRCVLRR